MPDGPAACQAASYPDFDKGRPDPAAGKPPADPDSRRARRIRAAQAGPDIPARATRAGAPDLFAAHTLAATVPVSTPDTVATARAIQESAAHWAALFAPRCLAIAAFNPPREKQIKE